MTRFSISQSWTLFNALVALWVLFSLTQVEAAVLRSHVSVTGNIVTLGDLFDDAGTAGDIVIAAAPRPGAPTAISVSRISQVARRNGIAWRNTQGLTRIVVSRSGVPLTPELTRTALADAIAEQAPTVAAKGLIEIIMTSGTENLMVTDEETPSISVEQISFDNRSGRFRAIVRVPANSDGAPRFRVTGRAYPALDIPVLTHRMSPGDKITEADVDWVRVPAARVSQNIIDDTASLIGFTPRRSLRPGEPVRNSDVEPPRMVEKGSIVSVTYVLANMSLTTRGRALEDGAMGEIIKIVNPRSHRTIEVEVTGTNKAVVTPIGPLRVSSLN
jgi:flagellar basal body P-ring formation protein FlgA